MNHSDQHPGRVVILGGGLAGSMLAIRLQLEGVEVTLLDDRVPNSASRVAAGLYNVITGRFGAKTWMAEPFLAELEAFLAQPALAGVQEFVQPGTIYRPCKDVEDYNLWSGRSADPAYASLIEFEEEPLFPAILHNPHGGIKILPGGWVQIGGLIDFLQGRLQTLGGSLEIGTFGYEGISFSPGSLEFAEKSISFDHLVACEGHRILENPFFHRLPIQPNKGEILEIEAPDLAALPFAVSKKVYLVPATATRWIVGSTYQNHFENAQPTARGRAEIEQHLQKVIRVPYEVVEHRAGIRPTTPNRRPILGTHPQYPRLHVCTGFGTKGMLAAPFCSRLLTDLLLGRPREIPVDMRLDRFRAFRSA